MAKERKTKTVHYKHAESKSEATLQQYLDQALALHPKPFGRQERIAGEDGPLRLISSYRKQNGMTFGQMLQYERGKDQTLIVIDEDTDDISIEQVAAGKTPEGKNREVLDSVMYFCVYDNHVVLLQSQALKARNFEQHLHWLFRDLTNVVPDDVAIYLSDHPTQKAQKAINKQPPKTISIGSVLETQPAEPNETPNQARSIQFRPSGRAADVLAGFFGNEWREKIRLEDSLDEANMEVQLRITYLRKTTEAGHRMLENIAKAARHMEPEDVEIDLIGGGKIKGNEIKLFGDVRVDIYGGVVDAGDLYERMYSWLRSMIEQGKVQ